MAAAAAISANVEIGHNLKSIQFRDPFYSQTHDFKGKECNEAIIYVLQSQQLPQNGRHLGLNWRLRLNTYSRGAILLLELQIDGSINNWFLNVTQNASFRIPKRYTLNIKRRRLNRYLNALKQTWCAYSVSLAFNNSLKNCFRGSQSFFPWRK